MSVEKKKIGRKSIGEKPLTNKQKKQRHYARNVCTLKSIENHGLLAGGFFVDKRKIDALASTLSFVKNESVEISSQVSISRIIDNALQLYLKVLQCEYFDPGTLSTDFVRGVFYSKETARFFDDTIALARREADSLFNEWEAQQDEVQS